MLNKLLILQILISSGLIYQTESMVQEFSLQHVYSNFHEVANIRVQSLVLCASFCASHSEIAKHSFCATFHWNLDDLDACCCGYLHPFVTGPRSEKLMYVAKGCKQSNMSAFIGTLWKTPGMTSAGMPGIEFGVSGVTSCQKTPTMPSQKILNGHKMIMVKGAIYSFGGRIENFSAYQGVREAYKYDLSANQWSPINFMTTAKYQVTLETYSENEIFLTGGFNFVEQQTTEIYNIDLDSYETGPNLPQPIYGHCLKQHKSSGHFYMAGGKVNTSIFTDALYRFDPMTNVFTELPSRLSMKVIFPKCNLLADEGLMIIAGGRTSPNSERTDFVDILKIDSEKIVVGKKTPTLGDVFIYAGFMFFKPSGIPNELYQYRSESDHWYFIEDLKINPGSLNYYLIAVEPENTRICQFI